MWYDANDNLWTQSWEKDNKKVNERKSENYHLYMEATFRLIICKRII